MECINIQHNLLILFMLIQNYIYNVQLLQFYFFKFIYIIRIKFKKNKIIYINGKTIFKN
jgi:hypothetical protein